MSRYKSILFFTLFFCTMSAISAPIADCSFNVKTKMVGKGVKSIFSLPMGILYQDYFGLKVNSGVDVIWSQIILNQEQKLIGVFPTVEQSGQFEAILAWQIPRGILISLFKYILPPNSMKPEFSLVNIMERELSYIFRDFVIHGPVMDVMRNQDHFLLLTQTNAYSISFPELTNGRWQLEDQYPLFWQGNEVYFRARWWSTSNNELTILGQPRSQDSFEQIFDPFNKNGQRRWAKTIQSFQYRLATVFDSTLDNLTISFGEGRSFGIEVNGQRGNDYPFPITAIYPRSIKFLNGPGFLAGNKSIYFTQSGKIDCKFFSSNTIITALESSYRENGFPRNIWVLNGDQLELLTY